MIKFFDRRKAIMVNKSLTLSVDFFFVNLLLNVVSKHFVEFVDFTPRSRNYNFKNP